MGGRTAASLSGTELAQASLKYWSPSRLPPSQPRPEPRLHQPQPTMGQQQLLLLVLGIVIVGLAVVVGIQAFGENQKKANSDAITNDVIRIASDAQAWSLKPTAFGGGNGSFAGVTFEKIGYTTGANSATAGNYGNLNGAYSLAVGSATAGGTTNAAGVLIVGCNKAQKNKVSAQVSGTGPNQIATTLTNDATCSIQS